MAYYLAVHAAKTGAKVDFFGLSSEEARNGTLKAYAEFGREPFDERSFTARKLLTLIDPVDTYGVDSSHASSPERGQLVKNALRRHAKEYGNGEVLDALNAFLGEKDFDGYCRGKLKLTTATRQMFQIATDLHDEIAEAVRNEAPLLKRAFWTLFPWGEPENYANCKQWGRQRSTASTAFEPAPLHQGDQSIKSKTAKNGVDHTLNLSPPPRLDEQLHRRKYLQPFCTEFVNAYVGLTQKIRNLPDHSVIASPARSPDLGMDAHGCREMLVELVRRVGLRAQQTVSGLESLGEDAFPLQVEYLRRLKEEASINIVKEEHTPRNWWQFWKREAQASDQQIIDLSAWEDGGIGPRYSRNLSVSLPVPPTDQPKNARYEANLDIIEGFKKLERLMHGMVYARQEETVRCHERKPVDDITDISIEHPPWRINRGILLDRLLPESQSAFLRLSTDASLIRQRRGPHLTSDRASALFATLDEDLMGPGVKHYVYLILTTRFERAVQAMEALVAHKPDGLPTLQRMAYDLRLPQNYRDAAGTTCARALVAAARDSGAPIDFPLSQDPFVINEMLKQYADEGPGSFSQPPLANQLLALIDPDARDGVGGPHARSSERAELVVKALRCHARELGSGETLDALNVFLERKEFDRYTRGELKISEEARQMFQVVTDLHAEMVEAVRKEASFVKRAFWRAFPWEGPENNTNRKQWGRTVTVLASSDVSKPEYQQASLSEARPEVDEQVELATTEPSHPRSADSPSTAGTVTVEVKPQAPQLERYLDGSYLIEFGGLWWVPKNPSGSDAGAELNTLLKPICDEFAQRYDALYRKIQGPNDDDLIGAPEAPDGISQGQLHECRDDLLELLRCLRSKAESTVSSLSSHDFRRDAFALQMELLRKLSPQVSVTIEPHSHSTGVGSSSHQATIDVRGWMSSGLDYRGPRNGVVTLPVLDPERAEGEYKENREIVEEFEALAELMHRMIETSRQDLFRHHAHQPPSEITDITQPHRTDPLSPTKLLAELREQRRILPKFESAFMRLASPEAALGGSSPPSALTTDNVRDLFTTLQNNYMFPSSPEKESSPIAKLYAYLILSTTRRDIVTHAMMALAAYEPDGFETLERMVTDSRFPEEYRSEAGFVRAQAHLNRAKTRGEPVFAVLDLID